MKATTFFLVLVAMLIVIAPMASAAEQSQIRGVTAQGPSGLLVSLGIEQAIPNLQVALQMYMWIAVLLLVLIAGVASQRNMRFFAILIPTFAGIFTWFGWLQIGWEVIICASLLGVFIYMKDSLKEKWGSGGPGSTIVNIAIYLIILQSTIGFVNSTAIWDHNAGTTTDNKWANVNLQDEMPKMSNAGGLYDDISSTLYAAAMIGLGALKMILTVLLSVALFSVVLYAAFPFLQVPTVVAFLAIMQVGIWFVYGMLIFTLFWKPMPDGGYF